MKTTIKSLLLLSAIATSASAQVITPIWTQDLNGDQGAAVGNHLPILRKNVGSYENNNGHSAMISLGKLLPYDSTRFLLYVRENGIDETVAGPADMALSAQFPDRSLIWINATNGAPFIPAGQTNAVAITWGPTPIAITGQGSQFDFFSDWGLDDDKNIYLGHKNKLIRFAKNAGSDSWASTPTCAWTEPTSGASDCSGNALDGTASGDGNQSMRWREFRVSGSGTNTTLYCGGGTWRQSSQDQLFVTTNGLDFQPIARLNSRDNGCTQHEYALGGQCTRVVKYGLNPSRPNIIVSYTGHYPGTGYGARPNRYGVDLDNLDPDNPARILSPWSYATIPSYTNQTAVAVLDQFSTTSRITNSGLPNFSWEAAGLNGTPETITVDGDQYYDGNWSIAMDAHASLDYIVNYSMPSWNNQYPVVNGTNYHRPGWIGVHRLDGSIAPNSSWKLQCTEADINNSDNGGNAQGTGTGNDWGYCGDITVVPDTTAPANLKKTTVFWSGGAYGFGLFTVQNVAAAISAPPPASITITEGDPLSISVGTTGSPNLYSWTKDNVAIDGTAVNLDTTLKYPRTVLQGVNKAKIAVTQTKPEDSGVYKLTVTNPLNGSALTASVNVTVNPDLNKPTVVSVTALPTVAFQGTRGTGTNPYTVKVLFSKRVDATSGSTLANYTITGGPGSVTLAGVTVQTDSRAATLGGDWRAAVVETTGLVPGATYTLNVSGITDQAQTPNTMNPVSIPFTVPNLVQGVLAWDYYYLGTYGGAVGLESSALFPSAPMTNLAFFSFDTSPYTANDLNNKAAFGALGDNYGDTLSGWVTPAVSGSYYFFLAGDDGSELYLSSDASPANGSLIASLSGANGTFQETNSAAPPTQTSDLQPLVAGKRYWVQAVHTEGGGGDYVKVAWRLATDTTPAGSLTPIPSQYLSAYAASAPTAPVFGTVTYSGGSLTIPWSSYQNAGVIQQSSDLKTWSNVAGNPNPLVVSPTAPKLFYRLSNNQ